VHVVQWIELPLADGEKAAHTSFAYNVGLTVWDHSTALSLLNSGRHLAACAQLNDWVYIGPNRNQGIVNRRNAEYEMCVGIRPRNARLSCP
jgi:lysozyme